MRRAIAAALLVVGSLLPGTLAAQGETAAPQRAGTLRVSIPSAWAHWNDRFGAATPLDPTLAAGTRESLGTYYSAESLGVQQLPWLASHEGLVQSLTGLNSFAWNLGRASVRLDASMRVTPIRLDFALSSRLGLTAALPIVRAWSYSALRGPDTSIAGSFGNSGWNPEVQSPGTMGPLGTEIDTVLRALTLQAASGPAALRAQAQALLGQLQPFGCGLVQLTAGGAPTVVCPGLAAGYSPVLPAGGTPAGDSLTLILGRFQTSYAALQAQYAAQGVTMPGFASALPLPSAPFDSTQMRQFFSDPNGPLQGDSLTSVARTGIGDIELGGWVQLAAGPRWRSQLALLVRLGTGKPDDPDNFVDIGTGDGQTDFELTWRNDVIVDPRLWVHAGIRYGIQTPGTLSRRVSPYYLPYALPATRADVERDLGDYLSLDLVPNLQLDDAFNVGLGWHYFRQGATTHSYVDPADQARTGVPASVLDEATSVTRMRIGAGITFSTLERYYARRARLPYRVTASYQNTFWGRGGQVAHAGVVGLAIELYLFAHR